MKRLVFWFGFLLLLGACAGPAEERPPAVRVPPGQDIAGLRIITEDGGHLAWSKQTNRIAFDRLGKDGYFDLWLMNPDGSGQICLTANHPLLPNKHIGQPAWHPGGKLLVIQAQKAHVPRYADTRCTPGAGALNDLWVITADGSRAWKIHAVRDTVSKDAAGVLHPQFSNDGTRLFWAERIRGSRRPFGEWILRIGDFYFDENSGPRLGAIRDYNPGGRSAFFESHNFSPDDRHVLFTGNPDGPLEIYEMNVANGSTRRVTRHAAMTWDEHAHYSPDGRRIVWMSSADLKFRIKPFDLQTDYWIMNTDGSRKSRLTRFHAAWHPHYLARSFAVAADFDWSPDGNRIMGLVITERPDTRRRGSGLIVLIDLPVR
ncbi:MAG: PD40 domain-containing protein [Deltaproteobacteria bacterium]|jgi:Tol biopolymer transport system component|nr:PD40 domain-containing protein [Deltaproteobacteria bacterium]